MGPRDLLISNLVLNATQKEIIDTTLRFSMDDLLQNTIDDPQLAIAALIAITTNPIQNEKKFAEKNILDDIKAVQKILMDKAPHQLLILRNQNGPATQVSKEAVIAYILQYVLHQVKLVNTITPQFSQYLKQNKEAINQIWQSCDDFGLEDITPTTNVHATVC